MTSLRPPTGARFCQTSQSSALVPYGAAHLFHACGCRSLPKRGKAALGAAVQTKYTSACALPLAAYPRTPHLPFSPGKNPDDVTSSVPTAFLGVPIIVTEKLDGGCCCSHRGNVSPSIPISANLLFGSIPPLQVTLSKVVIVTGSQTAVNSDNGLQENTVCQALLNLRCSSYSLTTCETGRSNARCMHGRCRSPPAGHGLPE